MQTDLIISELTIVFENLKAWLQEPPQGIPPLQGITNELAFKGAISFFEPFNVIPGAPGYFPIQFLFSGVIWQARADGSLTGSGSVFAVNQNFSPVNWLDLANPSLGEPQQGEVTLAFMQASGIRPASIRLDLADLHVTFESASGNALSVVLVGHAGNSSKGQMAIGCLAAPSVI